MQQEGGGVEGLMEKLMISMEALHINWTFFFLFGRRDLIVFIKWVLLRQA